MADQLPAVGKKVDAAGRDRITADAGKSDSIKAAKVKAAGGKSNFGIAIDWLVGGGWVKTTPEVAEIAAITDYNLTSNPGNFYQYKLEFTNTENYDYYFIDKTGDRYKVDCYIARTHNVEYNSDKPDMVCITGS